MSNAKTEGYPMEHVALSELEAMHDWIARMFRSVGIAGGELDEVTAACVRPAIEAVDAHRAAKAARRARLRLVK